MVVWGDRFFSAKQQTAKVGHLALALTAPQFRFTWQPLLEELGEGENRRFGGEPGVGEKIAETGELFSSVWVICFLFQRVFGTIPFFQVFNPVLDPPQCLKRVVDPLTCVGVLTFKMEQLTLNQFFCYFIFPRKLRELPQILMLILHLRVELQTYLGKIGTDRLGHKSRGLLKSGMDRKETNPRDRSFCQKFFQSPQPFSLGIFPSLHPSQTCRRRAAAARAPGGAGVLGRLLCAGRGAGGGQLAEEDSLEIWCIQWRSYWFSMVFYGFSMVFQWLSVRTEAKNAGADVCETSAKYVTMFVPGLVGWTL